MRYSAVQHARSCTTRWFVLRAGLKSGRGSDSTAKLAKLEKNLHGAGSATVVLQSVLFPAASNNSDVITASLRTLTSHRAVVRTNV